MLNITLLCVGKLKEPFYTQAAAEYAKRLSAYCKLSLVELPEERLPKDPSQAQIDAALAREADAIRAKLPPRCGLVALCVEGRMRSSEELAGLFTDWMNRGESHLVFLIGGSFGLHPSIKAEAGLRLSMSPMTFPHHLARVMLNEGSNSHKCGDAMDRKNLFVLLLRISAAAGALLGLLTALFDVSITPALLSLAAMLLFRFLAIRALRREAREAGE